MIEIVFNLPVLFFLLGIIAVLLGSNLSLPPAMRDMLTMYLMLAIGIKGGRNLASSEWSLAALEPILIVTLGSIVVASYLYFVCRRWVGIDTAAAIGATYGSNSTMTFIAAASFLTALDVTYGAYMIVALVLMETPAIIYSVFLARRDRSPSTWEALRDALTDGTHLLLIGSLIIGAVSTSLSGDEELLYRFVGGDIFTGALCFFLLGMGVKVGQVMRSDLLSQLDARLIALALIVPWLNGGATWLLGTVLGMSPGDLFLTVILMASASYIVAPAILEKTVPRAESGKYLTMSIAVTFPMNILIGVPVWWSIIA